MDGYRRVESVVPASDRFGGGEGRRAAPMVEFVKVESERGVRFVLLANSADELRRGLIAVS